MTKKIKPFEGNEDVKTLPSFRKPKELNVATTSTPAIALSDSTTRRLEALHDSTQKNIHAIAQNIIRDSTQNINSANNISDIVFQIIKNNSSLELVSTRITKEEKKLIKEFKKFLDKYDFNEKDISTSKLMRYALIYLIKYEREDFVEGIVSGIKKINSFDI